MFLPGYTTHLWQALDKMFATWHAVFFSEREAWKKEKNVMQLSREGLFECLVCALPKWLKPEAIQAAFEAVGWAVNGGVNKALFPKDHPDLTGTQEVEATKVSITEKIVTNLHDVEHSSLAHAARAGC